MHGLGLSLTTQSVKARLREGRWNARCCSQGRVESAGTATLHVHWLLLQNGAMLAHSVVTLARRVISHASWSVLLWLARIATVFVTKDMPVSRGRPADRMVQQQSRRVARRVWLATSATLHTSRKHRARDIARELDRNSKIKAGDSCNLLPTRKPGI